MRDKEDRGRPHHRSNSGKNLLWDGMTLPIRILYVELSIWMHSARENTESDYSFQGSDLSGRTFSNRAIAIRQENLCWNSTLKKDV